MVTINSVNIIKENNVSLQSVSVLVIEKVFMIPSSKLCSGWRGSMQVIVTDKGSFIDNPTMVTYQSKRRPLLGYNWEKEIGNQLSRSKDFIFDVSNGFIWLKHI